MRDPMSWALPVFRAFGVPVKVHVLFFIVAFALCYRQLTQPDNVVTAGDVIGFAVGLLFLLVLLHEYGHCFAGRAVGGEPHEILVWPLGGLASVDVPQHWRPHTTVAAAGPATNAAVCIACSLLLMAAGFLPNANPLANPYQMPLKSYADGRVYTSAYQVSVYKPGTAEAGELTKKFADDIATAMSRRDFPEVDTLVKSAGLEHAQAPEWAVWAGRAFWLSWVMILLNLLPAYPLDGGQIMQGLVWAKTDFRQGVTVAAYSGFVAGLLLLVWAFSENETFVLGLAGFVMYTSAGRLKTLEADDSGFGYDFSAGYTSLERDEQAQARPKKLPFLKRWLRARNARRLQREVEQRQQDEERFDQLLEKVHKSGKASLTDEERRFMERVSARYRNRS